MKFKVMKGTKLFDQLVKVGDQMRNANNEAIKLAKELGFTCGIRIVGELAGGISGFKSDTLPDGYVWKDSQCVFPRKNLKKNKEILQKINELPVLAFDVLNKPLKYSPFDSKEDTGGRFRMSWHPGISWKDEYVLLDVAEYMKYKPVKDMIEITVSEYEKLSKAKNKKVQKVVKEKAK